MREPYMDHPTQIAWTRWKNSEEKTEDSTRGAFIDGWNAALRWLPFRIAQFREIDEAQRKEIEDLKKQLESKT